MLPPILLIEDNPMDMDLTVRAFNKHRLQNPIEIARDGEEALAWIGKWDSGAQRPVVILLDLNLPKVHGLEVLRTLKSHQVYKSIPIIVLTTSNDNADLQSAYLTGVNSYIVKPVRFENFLAITEQIQAYWCLLNLPYLGE